MLYFKRGSRRILANYKMTEIYNFYKEQYGDEALPKEKVHEIYKKLFPEIVKLMVFENLDYRMPARLGYIRVKKKEVGPKIDKNGNLDTRKLSVDWKKTKRLWEKLYPEKTAEEIKLVEGKPVVREMNEHSGDCRLYWQWDKLTSNLRNQSAYFLNMVRDADNVLSHAVKMNKNINFYL
jgi:hypothetical protein